jgi:hypothetical protein
MSNFAVMGAEQPAKLPTLPTPPSTKPATDVLNYLFVLTLVAIGGYLVYRTFFTKGTAAAPSPLIADPGDWLREWKPWIRGATV